MAKDLNQPNDEDELSDFDLTEDDESEFHSFTEDEDLFEDDDTEDNFSEDEVTSEEIEEETTEEFENEDLSQSEEETSTEESDLNEPEESTPLERPKSIPIAPNKVPLLITIKIADIQISVDKLIQLEPGNMLDLNVNTTDGVELCINGKVVGKGELIKVGETLGVRILEIGR